MNAMRHLVRLVTAAIAGTLAMLVVGVSAASAGPAPLDQPRAPAPAPPGTESAGDSFWTVTSIGLVGIAAFAVLAVGSFLMITTVRHHHRGAPAAV